MLGAQLHLPERRDGERFWAFAEGALWGGGGEMAEMSSVQNPCWLMIMGDYTTQYIRDYTNPIGKSLKTNQYNGMIEGF